MNYCIVFVVSFVSATIFPLGSEGVLLYYANEGSSVILLLWFWASLGNTFGALTNWYLGRYLTRFEGRSWFPVTSKSRLRAEEIFNKYGVWTLLFCWLPIIGDAISLAAGIFKTPIKYFLPFVFIGKAARYGLLLWGQSWLLHS